MTCHNGQSQVEPTMADGLLCRPFDEVLHVIRVSVVGLSDRQPRRGWPTAGPGCRHDRGRGEHSRRPIAGTGPLQDRPPAGGVGYQVGTGLIATAQPTPQAATRSDAGRWPVRAPSPPWLSRTRYSSTRSVPATQIFPRHVDAIDQGLFDRRSACREELRRRSDDLLSIRSETRAHNPRQACARTHMLVSWGMSRRSRSVIPSGRCTVR